MSVRIVREARREDREAWGRLYTAYAEFYGTAQDEAMRERVWSWIFDPAQSVEALVAEVNGELVGLAHFRAFIRPLSATKAGFLDDLFVAEPERGAKIGEALIAAVAEIGRAREWSVIRWLTAENNYRARALYDHVATPTSWRVYDMKLG